MALYQEFIDILVPIDVIRQLYPGCWEKCLADHQNVIGHSACPSIPGGSENANIF